jgi:hypothetical protein
MSIKTVYTCDKCSKDNSSKETFQLFKVSVGHNMVYPTQVSTKTEVMPAQYWCRDCLNGSALLGITDKMLEERRLAEMSPVVPATLEDMIREIAGEAGAESAAEAIRNR